MKKLSLLILVMTAVNFSFAQSRYLVYFSDKGINTSQKLIKSSQEFISAEADLSPKSIERRIKNMGHENYITYADIPVKLGYIKEIEKLGIEIYRRLKWFNAVTCFLSNEQLGEISRLPFVSKIEPVKSLSRKPDNASIEQSNFSHKKNSSINNFDYGPSFNQYEMVDVMPVHRAGLNGEGVTIGIIDAGFDWRNHPATRNLDVLAEYDFIFDDEITSNEEGDPIGEHNHGTYVLSIAGGYSPGNIIGPAFASSFILAKTEYIATETRIEEDNYVAALQWLESIGVDIITSSVGYNIFDAGEGSYTYEDMDGKTSIITRASEMAFERGIVTITSAGNSGNDPWYYITVPADGENIIAVGAVNGNKQLASFSSHGPTYDGRIKPEVVAQGISVYMATPAASEYQYANGTSFSAPVVAGVAGLLLSAHPHLTNVQVRKILMESGDNSEMPNNDYGYGVVSAVDAVAFPNLSFSDEKYKLHKVFIDDDGVEEGSPKLHYSINGGALFVEDLVFDGNLSYTFQFPMLVQSDTVGFHFTYNTGSGHLVTIPVDKEYRFIYGSLNISLQTAMDADPFVPTESALLQNFPNPFNSETKIVFISTEEAAAQLKIYDILGRKVRDLFNGDLVTGTNSFRWDGKGNEGAKSPGGIYFYTLSSNGKTFTKKLVLLK